jgi:hypothetical protein
LERLDGVAPQVGGQQVKEQLVVVFKVFGYHSPQLWNFPAQGREEVLCRHGHGTIIPENRPVMP